MADSGPSVAPGQAHQMFRTDCGEGAPGCCGTYQVSSTLLREGGRHPAVYVGLGGSGGCSEQD